MTPDPRLNFLATLREAVGLSQAEVAQRFGLNGRQSYKSVAAWEKGESAPRAHFRARFIRYLWDDLRLHKEPTRFADYLAILVECWHWEPLRADERVSLRLPPSSPTQEREPDQPSLPSTIVNGTLIGGNVTTGGDFVGRDQIVHHHGFNADEVAKIIATAQRTAPALPPVTAPAAWTRKSFEPEVTFIPAGSFWLGRDDGAADERPRHLVTLPAYAISRQPITHAQYAAFVQAQPDHRPQGGGWRFTIPPVDKADEPVTGVSWHSAIAYCAWLTAQSDQPYRLPTEAEWEQAAQRAIITTALREWTSTIWGDDAQNATFTYPYQSDGRDHLTVSGVYRIWRRANTHPSARSRGFASPTTRLPDLGLRVALAMAA